MLTKLIKGKRTFVSIKYKSVPEAVLIEIYIPAFAPSHQIYKKQLFNNKQPFG